MLKSPIFWVIVLVIIIGVAIWQLNKNKHNANNLPNSTGTPNAPTGCLADTEVQHLIIAHNQSFHLVKPLMAQQILSRCPQAQPYLK